MNSTKIHTSPLTFFKTMSLALLLTLGSIAMTGCENDGPMEEAGERIDDAADDVGNAANDAADELEDATDELN